MKRELYCPTCKNDSIMEEKPFEWAEGIVINGFTCPHCGEILIMEKEHRKAVRAQATHLNTLTLKRQLFTLGKSIALRIPQDIAEQLKLKPRQRVELHTSADSFIVKPLPR